MFLEEFFVENEALWLALVGVGFLLLIVLASRREPLPRLDDTVRRAPLRDRDDATVYP